MAEPDKFYGKYRGTVLNNIDPMQPGRLLVVVPDVHGLAPSSWALPCFPFAGMQTGAWALPQIGAHVWVEFEQGDPDRPIWSGLLLRQRRRGAGARARRAARHAEHRPPDAGPEHADDLRRPGPDRRDPAQDARPGR